MKNKKIKNVILYSTLFIILVIFLAGIIPNIGRSTGSSSSNDDGKDKQKTETASNTNGEFNLNTPCSQMLPKNSNFGIDVGGPVYIKFTGSRIFYWNGKDNLNCPDRESGPVEITSADPNKSVWVSIKIY